MADRTSVSMKKISPLERHYIWSGGKFPKRPDTSAFDKLQGVSVVHKADKLEIKVTHESVWSAVNSPAADAIARAVGGTGAVKK